MNTKEFERLLLSVQKPGRYSGGEINSVIKDKEKVDVRFAFCFPDTYEIGMSHLRMKILYSLFNEREDIWCERVFTPWRCGLLHPGKARLRFLHKKLRPPSS